MESLQGHFLVAEPQQRDPNFVQTVVLVVQHTDQGAFGLIVNRPVSVSRGALWRRVSMQYCNGGRQLLYFGGPVTGPVMAVHTDPSLAEIEVLPDVFFTGKDEHILALIEQTEHPYKVFLGYAGWGPQQLEYEVAQGAWRTVPANATYVFSTRRDLWHEVSKHILDAVLQSMFHIRHIPEDPLLN
jgi:putative transcriptional regulator